MLKKRI